MRSARARGGTPAWLSSELPYTRYCLAICYLKGGGVDQGKRQGGKWLLKALFS